MAVGVLLRGDALDARRIVRPDLIDVGVASLVLDLVQKITGIGGHVIGKGCPLRHGVTEIPQPVPGQPPAEQGFDFEDDGSPVSVGNPGQVAVAVVGEVENAIGAFVLDLCGEVVLVVGVADHVCVSIDDVLDFADPLDRLWGGGPLIGQGPAPKQVNPFLLRIHQEILTGSGLFQLVSHGTYRQIGGRGRVVAKDEEIVEQQDIDIVDVGGDAFVGEFHQAHDGAGRECLEGVCRGER